MATVEDTSSARRKCVGCGAELARSAPLDLCPKCLLKLAMETQPGPGPAGTVMPPGTRAESGGLPEPGDQFGHYAILRALGAGAMGAVYEAQDLDSGRRVALKVLNHTLDSPDARERFFREGRLAASINHPNSVYVFGTEEIGGTPVIAMELVAGGTLQDRVRARGQLPIGEAVDSVLQIIEGLEAAQRMGILHRDIKPSNCYVGEDGAVKVGDFGLSISTTVRTEPALTATGAFLGTPAFCSPEQLRGEELNALSDMYAVGATLFYLLTGRTPFEAQTVVALLATVLEQRPPSPRKLRPEIPQGLAHAILRCLEKQSADRFKSHAELAQVLAPFGSTAPTPATLGLRFLAGVLDMLTLGVLGMPVFWWAFGSQVQFMNQSINQGAPKMLFWVFGCFVEVGLYYALFEGLWGAAVGKALCRLRVVGPDRNPPGPGRAFLRAVVYAVSPTLPFWLVCGSNEAYLSASQLTRTLMGLICYGIMGLLFCTARRRNGFAAVQDLVTKTRVVSKAALASPAVLPASETPPPAVESGATIGPYHVLQPLAESAGVKWLLGYDLRLLRKVWIRAVPPGTEPIPVRLRSLSRAGRLRWLTGKRSAEDNWDAFEALAGRSLLELAKTPQRWNEVRFWLHALACEISSAEKDGTLPELAIDRVWITGDGRAKLLDFPAPVLPSAVNDQLPTVNSASCPPLAPGSDRAIQRCSSFLAAVGTTALMGSAGTLAKVTGDVTTPLHTRAFLKSLPRLVSADAVTAALKPLLNRVAAVSRLRRAAVAGGCIVFAVLASALGLFGMVSARQFVQSNPGVMELRILLGARASRLRLLWRGIVAWCPLSVPLFLSILGIIKHLAWAPWLGLGLVGLLAVLSVALPGRGLQDRLAGTWPVPR